MSLLADCEFAIANLRLVHQGASCDSGRGLTAGVVSSRASTLYIKELVAVRRGRKRDLTCWEAVREGFENGIAQPEE